MACESNATKRVVPATFAWALLLFSTGLFFAYPCWYLMTTYSIAIPIAQGVITFFVIVNFTLATFMDPGVIPKALPDEFSGRETEPMHIDIEVQSVRFRLKWCVTCQFFRPPRCTHCGICDSCIERFDHHCPWLNNCIGRRNYRFFFLFLLWLSIHMIMIFSLCVLYVKHHMHRLYDLPTIVTLVILAIILVLFIPILGLTSYHVVLILRGRTTNEQVTGKFRDISNPYSKGCIKNLLYILCSSPYPSFKKLSDQYDEQVVHQYLENENANESHAFGKVSDSIHGGSRKIMTVDHGLPHESHSKDCEPSPPPYRNSRNNLYLNFNHPAYGKSASSHYIRSSRALTPPVANQNSHRFDHLRRSLPPQNRLHSSALHSSIQDTMSGVDFYLQDEARKKSVDDASRLLSTHYQQTGMYQLASPLTLPTAHQMYKLVEPKKNYNVSSNYGLDMSYTTVRFEDKKSLDMSDTCCLGNQTVDKLQEIATRTTMSGPLTVEACMQEAFNKRCSTFHGNHNRSQHDVAQFAPTSALSPVSVVGNTCVDCQRTNASSRSSLASMEHIMPSEMSRVPGRRPLSFVKAMEMSDAMEPSCVEGTHSQDQLISHCQHVDNIQSDHASDSVSSSGREVSYEIRV